MTQILMRDPLIVAALRLFETSAIVTVLAFLGTLQVALQAKTAVNWHDALLSLELGLASGLVNALIAYLTALQKQNVGTPDTPAPAAAQKEAA